jgi:nucleotide-binding universal stress UspA family protein
MPYKTILVHVDNGKRWPARAEVAVELAGRFEAHLVGLHAVTPAYTRAYRTVEAAPWSSRDRSSWRWSRRSALRPGSDT